MGKNIFAKWSFEYDEAIERSRKERKPVFMQFHRDPCSGCNKMYHLTYPDPLVEAELHRWFIPLRMDILDSGRIRASYNAIWTPSFYFLDSRGKDCLHFEGYLLPEDFRVVLRLGLVSSLLPRGKYREAEEILSEALDLFPNNKRAPQMMLKYAMAKYLQGFDNINFRTVMEKLRRIYPHSAEADMWPWDDQ